MRSSKSFRESLTGIVTVLNTPFLSDDTLDLAGVRANVRRAISAGVAGFLVPAMASEVSKLTAQERALLVQTVIEETAGAVSVFGGASAPSQNDRLSTAEALVGAGCDAVLVALPFHDEKSYERDLRELAAGIDAPLVIQDWDPVGYGVPVPLVARLFEEIPSFVSLKVEVVPAGPKYSALLEATGGRLHISGGWAVGQMIEALDRGVHTFMPTGMHEIYCGVFDRFHQGHRDEALTLFRRVLPILAFANQHLDISIHFFKRLLWREGLFATAAVRDPIMPFDAVHQSTADELIDLAMELTAAITPDQPG